MKYTYASKFRNSFKINVCLSLKLERVQLLDGVAGHCAHPVEENLQLLETLPDLIIDNNVIIM